MGIFTYDHKKPRTVRQGRMTLFPWSETHTWYRVDNHPMGPKSFPTWREAMHYANTPGHLVNA